MKKMNKKGFTIVELVIVIAVIAILSAVLIPTFSGVVANAKETAAVADAKAAYQQYVAAATLAGVEAKQNMVYKYADKMFVEIKDGQVVDAVVETATYDAASADGKVNTNAATGVIVEEAVTGNNAKAAVVIAGLFVKTTA